jgi:predicted nucleic acid-binding protein
MENVVFDASTLILLAKATLLGASLDLVAGHAPPTVLQEVRAGQGEDTQIIEAMIAGKRLEQTERILSAARLARDFALGAGEAEALATATARGWLLATDDRKAIVSARAMTVPCLTAIHFLEALRAAGKIGPDEASAKLERLARSGRYAKKILDDARERLEGGKP